VHQRRIEIKIRLSNEIGGSSGTHQLGRRRVGRDEPAFEDLRIQTVGKSLDDRPVRFRVVASCRFSSYDIAKIETMAETNSSSANGRRRMA